jgi:hypothetical protein
MEGLENTFSDLAAFSLGNNDSIGGDSSKINYYYFLIFAGIALLVIIIGVYAYKYFSNGNSKKVHFSEQPIEQQEYDDNYQ